MATESKRKVKGKMNYYYVTGKQIRAQRFIFTMSLGFTDIPLTNWNGE